MSRKNVAETDEEYLDGLLGKLPRMAEDEPESKIEAVEDEANEPEEEAPDDEDDDEDLPTAAEEAEPEVDEKEAALAAEKRRADGLQQEVSRLRKLHREQEIEKSRMQAPTPARAPEPATTEPKKPKGVAVVVSDDGSEVTVDQAALDALIESRARETYEKASRPTPEQLKQHASQTAVTSFINENPEVNQGVIATLNEVDQYVSTALQVAIGESGYTPRDFNDVMQIVKNSGIEEKVGEFYPEVVPHLREFIESQASEVPAWRQQVWRRIAQTKAGGGRPAEENPKQVTPKLRNIADGPRSLAKLGGERSVSDDADEQEFEKLQKDFRKDIFNFPDKKHKRYKELGRKLGKPGLE